MPFIQTQPIQMADNIADAFVIREKIGGINYVEIDTLNGSEIIRLKKKIEIESTDNSNRISIYHDNTDAYFRTDDGSFVFISDEIANTRIEVRGGSGLRGFMRLYDQNDAEYMELQCTNGVAQIYTDGTAPGDLELQPYAVAHVSCFANAASGETRELKITGFRATDLKRSLSISVGASVANQVDFTGLSKYFIDGDLLLNTLNGIDINPGSDVSADLITVGVTDAPKLEWNETGNAFVFSKDITVQSTSGGAAKVAINAGASRDSLIEFQDNGTNKRVMGYDWSKGSFVIGTTSIITGTYFELANSGLLKLAVLSVNQAVFTNANKQLVSNAITGTGSVVMSASPTLSGTITVNGSIVIADDGYIGNVTYPQLIQLTAGGGIIVNSTTFINGNEIFHDDASTFFIKSGGDIRFQSPSGTNILTLDPTDTYAFDLDVDQNAITYAKIDNDTSDAAAGAGVYIDSSGNNLVLLSLSSGYTTSNQYIADSCIIEAQSAANLVISNSSDNPISFWVNGVQQMKLNSTGLEGAKWKDTALGGRAIKLTNKTGAATVKGQQVKTDTANDDAVILTAVSDDECIGVFLDSGVADGSEAWVVTSGIADVAFQDNTAAASGDWVGTSTSDAGYAVGQVSPPAAPRHFEEVAHCTETVAAGGAGVRILAHCVLHQN